MGKVLAGGERPGSSAYAEFRRARRQARRCRQLRAAWVAAAVGAVGWAVAAGRPGPAAAGIGAGLLGAWRLRPDHDVDRWRRGAAGEVATALLLARLPARFVVLHDLRVQGSRANIDHLVIGPTGVWVVDSKSFRAPLRVRRGIVWAGDHEVATAPAAWQAQWTAARLHVERVQAVVAVHGTGLRRRGARVGDVRVLPAGGLCRWLRRGPRVLGRAEVAALASTAGRWRG